jgi:hypothetical protein
MAVKGVTFIGAIEPDKANMALGVISDAVFCGVAVRSHGAVLVEIIIVI